MRILVVDDNRSAADALARTLRKHGDDAEALYNGIDAIDALQTTRPDLILTDLKMEPIDGLGVLEAARALRPPIEVIVFTAYGSVDSAVRAMQLGARDFLTKPVTVEQLYHRIEEIRTAGQPSSVPRDDADEIPFFDHAPASAELRAMLERAAKAPSTPVWLEGEIGSGRGQAAATLHRLAETDGPIVTLEASRGMEWPTSGTVVLANVDDLPDDLQRDLVRQLSRASRNIRIIATAGPDSEERVAKGELRPDLYYKLAVIKIGIPPLRERREDIIPMLADALVRYAKRFDRPVPLLPESQEARLVQHTWPGNVRELLSVAERAVVLGSDALATHKTRVAPTHLPTLVPGFSLPDHMDKHERAILMEAWRVAGGEKSEMIAVLGIIRQTLDFKLKRFKVPE